jgi:hypothetical protein
MAFAVHAAHGIGISLHHLADHEERGLHAFAGEQVEDAIGIGRQRAVVEGQHHLVVLERQRFIVLPAAQPRVLGRIHHQRATHAERVRRAFGGARRPDAGQGRQQTTGRDFAAHASVPTLLADAPRSAPAPRIVNYLFSVPEH